MSVVELVSLFLGIAGLGATIGFGVRTPSARKLWTIMKKKKKRITQKQGQRNTDIAVQVQRPGEQKQAQRGPGMQVQTLELDEEEPAS